MSGGRLFHSGAGSSYQRISGNLRPFLKINRKETIEIDITAATIQFLSVVSKKYLGKNLLSKRYLSFEDPYQFFLTRLNSDSFQMQYGQNEQISRDSLKNIIYTLAYSPSRFEKSYVNRCLRLLGQRYSYLDLKDEFPEFCELIHKLKFIPLPECGDKNHPSYLLIFKEESRYAREVLKRGCLDEKFPILPLHDSFITPKDCYSKLEKIICDVSKDLYGHVLMHKRKF
jgi:hypothetical protein